MSGNPSTAELETTYITLPEPRRTWLMHCTDAFGKFGVCMVNVEDGAISIYAPDGSEGFVLNRLDIAEFRAAFTAAIRVAEADLRAKATAAPTQPSP